MNSSRLFFKLARCFHRGSLTPHTFQRTNLFIINSRQPCRTLFSSRPSGKRKPFQSKFSFGDYFFSRVGNVFLVAILLYLLTTFPLLELLYTEIRNAYRLEVERRKFIHQLDEMERAHDTIEARKAATVDKKSD